MDVVEPFNAQRERGITASFSGMFTSRLWRCKKNQGGRNRHRFAGIKKGGGIAPAILAAISAGGFRAAFNSKGRLTSYVSSIPVYVIKAGADERSTSVTVLSAYKQGYSWLYDVVRPALEGQAITPALIERAATLAVEAANPINDQRGSVEFRKHLVRVLTRRTLITALERANA